MAILAAARTLEKRFALLRVAGKEFFDGIGCRDTGGIDGLFRASVKIGGDIRDLLRSRGKRRHAFVRPAVSNDFADQIAFDVVRYKGRSHQIGATSAGRVGAMAECTSLRKEFLAALDGRRGLAR